MGWGSTIGAGLGSFLGPAGTAAGGALGGMLDANSSDSTSGGIQSSIQGSNPPPPGVPAKTETTGAAAGDLLKENVGKAMQSLGGSAAGGIESLINDKITGGAGKQGRNAREYLDNAFPELNAWEKSGAGASGAGTAQAEQNNAYKMKKMELNNAKDIAGIQSATAIKTAQISSAPSHERNVLDTPRIEADISRIYAQGSLTREQAAHEVYKTFLTQVQTTGQQVNTEKMKSEINRIVAQTFNERYASSTPGKIAKDLGLLLSDNISGNAPVPSHVGQGIPDPIKKPNFKGK